MRSLVVALCAACAPTNSSPRTPPKTHVDAGPAVDTAGWVDVDVGPFSFRAPAEIVRVPVQGIDSLVGKYTVGGITITFDYGRWSNELTDFPQVEGPDIDGHTARWVEAVSDHKTWVGIAVRDVAPGKHLEMSAELSDAGQVELARRILATVRFHQ